MEKVQEKTLLEGFVDALIFPFKPGVLLYNVLALLLVLLFFFIPFSAHLSQMKNRTALENDQAVASETLNDEQTLTQEQQEQLDIANEMLKKMGLSDEEIAHQQVEMRQAIAEAENSGSTAGFNLNTTHSGILSRNPMPFAPSIPMMLGFFLIFCLVTTRNFDITAQIAEGEFDAPPSLRPNNYVSIFIVLKYFAATFLLGIGFAFLIFGAIFIAGLLSALSGILGIIALVLVFLLYLGFFALYPAIILTIIRTNSVFDTIKPKNIRETISDHVGTANYLILLVLLVLMAALYFAFSAIQLLLPTTLFFVFGAILYYANFHLLSSNHYLMGFLTQHGTDEAFKGDFGGYQHSHKKQHTDIDDAELCIKNEHPEDAIALLNNAINRESENPDTVIPMYQLLNKTYKQMDNARQAEDTTRSMVAYVMSKAPHLKHQVLPAMLDLFSEGQYQPAPDVIYDLAQTAFGQQDYNTAVKVVGAFAKNNPDHKDLVANYLLVGKSLSAQKQYEKAYRLLAGLLKKHPEHTLAIEVKSELLSVKRKLLQQREASQKNQ